MLFLCGQLLTHPVTELYRGGKHARWLDIIRQPRLYVDIEYLPDGFCLCDPSHMQQRDVTKLYNFWLQRQKDNLLPLQIIKPVQPGQNGKNTKRKLDGSQGTLYVEIDDEEELSADFIKLDEERLVKPVLNIDFSCSPDAGNQNTDSQKQTLFSIKFLQDLLQELRNP